MRSRTIKKNFWLNYKEDRQLKYLVSLSNLSEANVVRKLLFETNIKANPPKDFYSAIEKINKIGVNINQLTKIANTTHQISEINLNRELNELNKLIKLLMERFI